MKVINVFLLIIAFMPVSAVAFQNLRFNQRAFLSHTPPQRSCVSCIQLNAFLRNIFRRKKQDTRTQGVQEVSIDVDKPPDFKATKSKRSNEPTEQADICVIGGGVSGLAAAITAAEANKKCNIVLLEANNEAFGGRVKTVITKDGYVLDRGFAVFVEEYPAAKKLLNYDDLKLEKFLPGARIKLWGRSSLARVADPFRQPDEILPALVSPVGSILDKASIIPLIFHCQSNLVEELFMETETDTLSALKNRWELSDDIVEKFFMPFLEGIYLAPLEEQSSRMFLFIFKMFSEGSASLPAKGMGAVPQQLVERAKAAGVDLRLGQMVVQIKKNGKGFLVETEKSKSRVQASNVIIATDGETAQKIMSTVEGFESLQDLPKQPQRAVGNLYYAFKGPAPLQEPVLILSGLREDRGTKNFPINNICFPSVVNKAYAPEGYNLCSVTVLQQAMDAFDSKDELDKAVRNELATWFPDSKTAILNDWELKAIFDIFNAQPSQYKGPYPACVHGGRDSTTYRGKALPPGLMVCGDHQSTATLNGALESGIAAGSIAAKAIA